MRNLIEKIKLIYRRNKVRKICEDIDWAKGELLKPYCDENLKNLALNYIELCYEDLKGININMRKEK